MSINHIFRKRKNSHEFFFGNMFEEDSGATILELRLMEIDGRGGSKDSRKSVFGPTSKAPSSLNSFAKPSLRPEVRDERQPHHWD